MCPADRAVNARFKLCSWTRFIWNSLGDLKVFSVLKVSKMMHRRLRILPLHIHIKTCNISRSVNMGFKWRASSYIQNLYDMSPSKREEKIYQPLKQCYRVVIYDYAILFFFKKMCHVPFLVAVSLVCGFADFLSFWSL